MGSPPLLLKYGRSGCYSLFRGLIKDCDLFWEQNKAEDQFTGSLIYGFVSEFAILTIFTLQASGTL